MAPFIQFLSYLLLFLETVLLIESKLHRVCTLSSLPTAIKSKDASANVPHFPLLPLLLAVSLRQHVYFKVQWDRRHKTKPKGNNEHP